MKYLMHVFGTDTTPQNPLQCKSIYISCVLTMSCGCCESKTVYCTNM